MQTVSFAGGEVPALGFGTHQLRGIAAEQGVLRALEVGYRHIDTASAYGNEAAVGRAIADGGVDRSELFITTKVWFTDASRPEVHRSAEQSLERLALDHIELLLLHWPSDHVAPMEESLEALIEVQEQGLTRHIGVSNFPAPLLDRALQLAPIVTNQVEHHPYLGVDEIREVLAAHGAFLTAYAPLARGRVADDPVLIEIAQNHQVTAAQVALRWLVQHGDTSAIPRSSNPDRIEENFGAMSFELSPEEIAQIDGLERGQRLVDPDFAPDWNMAWA